MMGLIFFLALQKEEGVDIVVCRLSFPVDVTKSTFEYWDRIESHALGNGRSPSFVQLFSFGHFGINIRSYLAAAFFGFLSLLSCWAV